MSNPIKYSTGSETLALKKGNFYIGTGDVGKGPTSTTGYYNGITPPSGGYTVYLNKASGGPSIYTCANDTELISITNSIAGTSYTTANECLTYFSSQTDKIVLNRDYEGIVTDGLVFNLDAGFTPSYPKNGTNAYDLSEFDNNMSLVNGTQYTTDNGGTFYFDGSDDYITRPTSSSLNMTYNISLLVWFRIPQNGLPYRQCLVGKHYREYELGIYPGGYIHTYTSRGPNNCGEYDEGMSSYKPGGDWVANTWYHVAWTLDGRTEKSYFDGVYGSSYTKNNSGTCPTNTFNLEIGRRSGGGGLIFKGDIPIVQIYNRTLTAEEILQNYNAQKGRFGL